MTGEHSSSQYNHDLEVIRSQVLLMGGLVESHFREAMQCYRSGDSVRSQAVVKSDEEVNRLEKELDDLCSHLIVKRQPAANDLRTVMATSKVITDLERIGDESTKIARIAQDMREKAAGAGEVLAFSGFEVVSALAEKVEHMLHQALDVFARQDQANAMQVIAFDKVIDGDHRLIMHHLVSAMTENGKVIVPALEAIWVAKAIERIGDHAKNIAEHTIYIVEGRDIRHLTP